MNNHEFIMSHAPINPQLFPWIVRIIVTYTPIGSPIRRRVVGSGIVVSPHWVLTVGHLNPHDIDNDEEQFFYVYQLRRHGRPLTEPSWWHPDYEPGLYVDEIRNRGSLGDFMALHLEDPLVLRSYAPLGLFYQLPITEGNLEPQQVTGFGFAGLSRDNPLLVPDTFHSFLATTERVQPDEYHGGREVLAAFEPRWGSSAQGDSGGPIMFNDPQHGLVVIGLITGGEPLGVSPPSHTTFVPLEDNLSFIESLRLESISLGQPITISNFFLFTLGWSIARWQGPGGSGGSGVANSAISDADLSGWRVFWQKVKDGASWSDAKHKDILDPKTKKIELEVEQNALWRATVLPLIGDPPQLVGKAHFPEANLPKSLVGSTADKYTMPTNLKVIAANNAGKNSVHASWDEALAASGIPAAGYRVFFQGKTASGAWSSWSHLPDMDKREVVFQVTSATDIGPWRVVVLPLYTLPNVTAVVGADEHGNPFAADADTRGVQINKPILTCQFPEPEETLYITEGTIGSGSVTALFNSVDPDTKEGSLQWEWADSADGKFIPGGRWVGMSGQNSVQMVFGTKDDPATENNSGWYRLRATNNLGESISQPVHVVISNQVIPLLLDQTPVSYGEAVGYTNSAGDAEIEVLFTAYPAPTNAQVMWEKLDPATQKYTPNISDRLFSLPLQSYGKEKEHKYIATLVFGQEKTYPTEEDSGWYIAHIKTTFADKSEHETYSLPVFVSIGASVN
ncbi:trypsin-like serine protease [Xenorhabdus stockiae]|uniref:trypsin-like serine protease n=1 Tax=Xenorhabdus stockiae TaxID=351614 RepID=UPI0040630F30